MSIGDLVRLANSKKKRMGLVIDIENPESIQKSCIMDPWHKCLILWPDGSLYWDYDIDLELERINDENT
tara:strand:- start:1475 stop:1681 length:207 start_codon:yes stop_codon:yes gene_type:complete